MVHRNSMPAGGDAPKTMPQLVGAFQSELDTIVRQTEVPGMTAAFVLDDGRSAVVCSGMADLETGELMSPCHRMLGASTGKMFVGALCLLLAIERKLDLDAPLGRYLGSQAWSERVTRFSRITVRQLLTHTSGLQDHVLDEPFLTLARRKRTAGVNWVGCSPVDVVAIFADKPVAFEAGDDFLYSDSNYVLAGLIIEAVTARSFYDLVTERFIRALGLALTEPAVGSSFPLFANGYMKRPNALGLGGHLVERGEVLIPLALEYAAGGFVTNSLDLARWAKLLLEGRLAKQDYLPELVTDGGDLMMPYGLGIETFKTSLGVAYGHTGWHWGHSSVVHYWPGMRLAVAAQVNRNYDVDCADYAQRLGAVLAAGKCYRNRGQR